MKNTPSNMPNTLATWMPRQLRPVFALAIASFAMIVPCSADSYATIARAGDSITLEKGETALVYSASGVIAYSAAGKQCAFLRFSQKRDRTSTVRETSAHPLPLVGPAKITIRSTDGFCGMRIVYTGLRASEKRAQMASAPPVKSAKLK